MKATSNTCIDQQGSRMPSVQQVEQLARVANELVQRQGSAGDLKGRREVQHD
ncbi:hypothetical protein [Cupriavidus sp. SK-3]|uniref:hypothetical protein n=1 Tax=Cupriavidus sp. SK-3 TaxID=1470558 RepID=UPI0013635877|nr:hypothetical protein [Cupriavidus sp. SK-3]